ncbi:hypothetical protein [Streptomyces sp. NBC_00582]|uniref:hypothetical protein n=1 Tax=Streptomyces sp. NBC_00582 TaxID=2975783 RepID=UPI002E80A37D|nr:hypothetical protein [Streptomyces sp. NBC_00582]WUB63853.1 hypothetical protein OG852_27405 [Streptomyces sp. NBC_00582]
MSALTSLCQLVLPGKGRRRAARPPAKPADPYVRMLRPVEAMATDIAYCPAEQTETLHAFLRMGGRICWTCRTLTMGPTPPGGVE